jgi:hypothetical protein
MRHSSRSSGVCVLALRGWAGHLREKRAASQGNILSRGKGCRLFLSLLDATRSSGSSPRIGGPRLGLLGDLRCLKIGKCGGGFLLPLALAFEVQREEPADLFAEIPDCGDSELNAEVCCVGISVGWDVQPGFAASVQFAQQGFAIEKPRVGQCFGWSLFRCHSCEVLRSFGGGVHRENVILDYRGFGMVTAFAFLVTRGNCVGFVDMLRLYMTYIV